MLSLSYRHSNLGTHPHAVKSVNGVDNYTYDANGNAIGKWYNNAWVSLAYDSDNHLTSIGSVRYVFDYRFILRQYSKALFIVSMLSEDQPSRGPNSNNFSCA
jgi:hypothetical protein